MLGDTVLVAAQEIGNGRLICIGDTTGFSNAMLTARETYVGRVVDWLAGRGAARTSLPSELVGLALLVACVIGIGRHARDPWTVPVIAAVAMIGAVGVRTSTERLSTPRPLGVAASESRPKARPVAIIDDSHVSWYSHEGLRDEGLGALNINLMREGFQPVMVEDLDEDRLAASRVVFNVNPADRFDDADVDRMLGYMRAGGTIVLATGYEERAAAQPLLDRLGLHIGATPLGRSEAEVVGSEHRPRFVRAWPVLGGKSVATAWGHAVCAEKAVGDGHLVVVGDPHFFMSHNIETKAGAQKHNVEFLRFLLERVDRS